MFLYYAYMIDDIADLDWDRWGGARPSAGRALLRSWWATVTPVNFSTAALRSLINVTAAAVARPKPRWYGRKAGRAGRSSSRVSPAALSPATQALHKKLVSHPPLLRLFFATFSSPLTYIPSLFSERAGARSARLSLSLCVCNFGMQLRIDSRAPSRNSPAVFKQPIPPGNEVYLYV